MSNIRQEHWTDDQGRPAGGVTEGTGFTISWQNGPLGRGAERREPNGAFVEHVIEAAIGRIMFYQGSEFASDYNAEALHYLLKALAALNLRTQNREIRKVEGTHEQ